MGILGPEYGVVLPGDGKNDAVGEGKLEFDGKACGIEGEAVIEIDAAALSHQCDGAQGVVLVALLQDAFEDFEQTKAGNDQMGCVLDGGSEKPGVRAVGEIFRPASRIDAVHAQSFSRGTVASISRRKPRNWVAFSIGSSSIRLS